jgi:hypothetical protein
MSSATIKPSKDYRLHLTVRRIAAPPDCVQIKVESQWLGAKNPEGRQTVFDRTMTFADAVIFATTILWEVEHTTDGVEFM